MKDRAAPPWRNWQPPSPRITPPTSAPSGAIYLIAYCHLRHDVRMFGVDRIRSMTITNHPCQLPLNFDLDAYVQDALVVMRGEQIEVELLFDRRTTAWVRDRIWHLSQPATTDKEGCLNLVLRAADTPELLGWILSFASGVRVIRPESLRERVLAAAAEILRVCDPGCHAGVLPSSRA